MLSENDIKDYMLQLKKLESDMFHAYKKCAEIVEDKEIKDICKGLFKAEARHDYTLKKIIPLINSKEN